jgi:hypothetical protein
MPHMPGNVAFCYPNGIALRVADIPGAQWQMPDSSVKYPSRSPDSQPKEDDPELYGWCRLDQLGEHYGMERGFSILAETIKRDGPFDGVVGFSQGAGAAVFIASLLEAGRQEAFERCQQAANGLPYPKCFLNEDGAPIQDPFKFVVSFSGFHIKDPIYCAFFDPHITTPLVQFIGLWDPMVEESSCLDLVGRFDGQTKIVYHPGAHFVPTQERYASQVAAFIYAAYGHGNPVDGYARETRLVGLRPEVSVPVSSLSPPEDSS